MRFVVLTKSEKKGNFCVAGIDVSNGKLVRLVSSDVETNCAIPRWCMGNVDVLDEIDVNVSRCVPFSCQQENVEVELQRWEKVQKKSLDDIVFLVDNRKRFIFEDNCFYLDESVAQNLSYSLMMVQVSDLQLSTNLNGKTKANFIYNGIPYSNMSVTDSEYYNKNVVIGNAILVVSIPDDGHPSIYYEGRRYYKFVSRIFEIS